jgi:hypothetical protein
MIRSHEARYQAGLLPVRCQPAEMATLLAQVFVTVQHERATPKDSSSS